MPNLVLFGHHKCASTWMGKVFYGIQERTGLRIAYLYRPECEINIHPNARRADVDRYGSLRGVHLIRDPRDVVVSGYYSHKKTHPPVDWKAMYELREKLNKVPKHEGLFLEMDFLEPHFRDMHEWDYSRPEILELRYEEVTSRGHLDDVFAHLGFKGGSGPLDRAVYLIQRTSNKLNNRSLWPFRYADIDLPVQEQQAILEATSFEKLSGSRRKGQENIDSHYRKGVAGDWVNHFEPEHKEYFKQRFGGLLKALGYERDDSW